MDETRNAQVRIVRLPLDVFESGTPPLPEGTKVVSVLPPPPDIYRPPVELVVYHPDFFPMFDGIAIPSVGLTIVRDDNGEIISREFSDG